MCFFGTGVLTSFWLPRSSYQSYGLSFQLGPPHKLSSIISSLLTQRQPGQVNSNPSLTTAAALWARHSQHLKNSRIEKDLNQKDQAREQPENNSIITNNVTATIEEEGKKREKLDLTYYLSCARAVISNLKVFKGGCS